MEIINTFYFILFIYLFKHHRIVSAVKRIEFVSDRVSYIVLRCHWCNIILLNVHEPSEEKSYDSKDSFYEELEQVFDLFPTYHMNILLGDFNAKLGREDIFKPTKGNESLQDSNDNGVRIVNFATSKIELLRARRSRTEASQSD
jgi:exonuclease III